MPRLVQPEQEGVRPARESSRAVVRDVDPAGARAVGLDREGADGVREARRRLGRGSSSPAAPRALRGVSRARSGRRRPGGRPRARTRVTKSRQPRARARRSHAGAPAHPRARAARTANARAARASGSRRRRRSARSASSRSPSSSASRPGRRAFRAPRSGGRWPIACRPRAPADLRLAQSAGDRPRSRRLPGAAGARSNVRAPEARLSRRTRPRSRRRSSRGTRAPPGPAG